MRDEQMVDQIAALVQARRMYEPAAVIVRQPWDVPRPPRSLKAIRLRRFKTNFGRGPKRWFVACGYESVPVGLALLHPIKTVRYLCKGGV